MRKHLNVAKRLAKDGAVPGWMRGLLVFGLLPIPGPVDDVVLVIVVLLLVTVYRHRVVHHYAIESLEPVVPDDTWGCWG